MVTDGLLRWFILVDDDSGGDHQMLGPYMVEIVCTCDSVMLQLRKPRISDRVSKEDGQSATVKRAVTV